MAGTLAAARHLVAPSLRSLPAWPLAGAAASALALGALATQTSQLAVVRLAAVALAAGAALAVPDPSAPTVEAAPVGRAVRTVVRLAPLLAGWVAAWGAVLALAHPPATAALTAEALVLLLAAVAVALVAERRGYPPLAGVTAPLVLLGLGLLAPGPLGVLDGGSPPAAGAGLAVVGALAVVAAAASLVDPGGRLARRF